MAAFKAHCRIGFWKADLLRKGPAAALAGLDSVTQVSELPSRAALTALVQAAMKLNEDGVLAEWQKAQQEKRKNPAPVKPPPALAAALRKNARARKTWDPFTPSHRRDYVEWIAAARKDETRDRRVQQTVEWLVEGKTPNWRYTRRAPSSGPAAPPRKVPPCSRALSSASSATQVPQLREALLVETWFSEYDLTRI